MKLLYVCALVVVSSPALAAQGPAASSPPQRKATIALADAAAPPEWELRVPVSLTLAKGTAVGRMTIRIDYPAKVFEYKAVEKSDQLQQASVELEAKPVQGAGAAKLASLQVQLRATGDEEVLPSGVLAILVFTVAKSAEAGPQPMRAAEVRAWSASPPVSQVAAGAGPDATITVAPPGLSVFSCFFSTH